MTDEALVRAARALRDSRQGAYAGSAGTRARILQRAVQQRRRRRRMAIVLLPLAATFALSTAWAAAAGRLPALVARWLRAVPVLSHHVLAGSRASSSGGAAVVAPPVTGATNDESISPRFMPDAQPPAIPTAQPAPPLSTPGGSRHHAQPPPSQGPVTAAPGPTTDAEGPLYAAAHAAHFVDRDAAAALRAWDAYLAAYPDGRLALEARYNRALTLVRLGRLAEARTALAPFAQGALGGYRQREARSLLEALDAPPEPR